MWEKPYSVNLKENKYYAVKTNKNELYICKFKVDMDEEMWFDGDLVFEFHPPSGEFRRDIYGYTNEIIEGVFQLPDIE